jgi:hypothetical protein
MTAYPSEWDEGDDLTEEEIFDREEDLIEKE